MRPVDFSALGLEPGNSERLRPALAWLRARSGPGDPSPALVTELLTREVPQLWRGRGREQHEVAWGLGDVFEQAGLAELASLCRSHATHETLAVWQWAQSFADVPSEFWAPALAALQRRRVEVPARAALSLSSAHALLTVVGDGLRLTPDAQLPLATVQALDDRFRWTEEFPWMRVTEESAVAPLRLIHEHLVAQRLLVHHDGRVSRTAAGVAGTRSTATLWRAVVDPAPRWTREFERDALGVMAASVLRSADLALGRIGEEMTHVLAAKWRPTGNAGRSNVFDGAAPLAQAWYHLGVPLGWWDTGRGPADRTLNAIGWSAAVSVFRAVAGPVRGSAGAPPA